MLGFAVLAGLVLLVPFAGADDPPPLPQQGNMLVDAGSADPVIVTFPETGMSADNCNPASGSAFPPGPTTVTCSPVDAPAFNFVVTVVKPVFGPLPSPQAEESSAAGAVVTYDVPPVTDVVSVDSVVCDPPSGSTFALGPNPVTCTATDSRGNSSTASFTVTVTPDTTKPVLGAMPAPAPVEGTSPAGAVVEFATPTAADAFPVTVGCAPASGSVFAVGPTTVTCTATDANANATTGSFVVTVTDTTPPVVAVPESFTVTAPDASGAVLVYAATAIDTVDGVVPVTCLPASGVLFKVGATTVRCSAKDAAGNASPEARFTVTVAAPLPGVTPPPTTTTTTTSTTGTTTATPRPSPAPGPTSVPTTTTPPRATPAAVSAFAAKPANRRITLTWAPAGPGGHVELSRSSANGSSTPIYTGSATSFVDTKLRNGIKYRYAIVFVDAGGAHSSAVSVAAAPKASLLVSPAAGARIARPPTLRWVPAPKASYYNVQLYRGGRKILSIWPGASRLTLRRHWTFAGHGVTLSPGVYRWLVWPGFGPHRDKKYGGVLGESSFTLSG
jgi:fibronectin type 3 domain-containing protein